MSGNKIYEFLKKNSIFSNLNEESLNALCSISEELSLKKGGFLTQEGDEAKEIFFILDGDLEVIKYDDETKTNFIVNVLHGGDSVGEQALIDKEGKSASIRAATDAHLFKISFESLEKLTQKNREFDTIYSAISRRTSKKLRETTDVAALALKRELQEYKNRVSLGSFLVYVITTISFLVYTVSPLKYALSHVKSTSYVSIPYTIALIFFSYLMVRVCPFPPETFGFTMRNWKKSVVEGIVFTLPIMGLIVLCKWLLIQYIPVFKEDALFDPFALKPGVTFRFWLFNAIAYCIFVPVQEIMVRGALQGPLEKFLASKHKVWISIIISNLIYSSAHVFLSDTIAFAVFVMGLYLGWLYSRTHNLIGVIIAHWIIGVWGLSVVGVRIH